MPSDLFDSLLELALDLAKKGARAKPPVPAPSRIVPMLTFAKVPLKAKEALLDVIDGDAEFRARLLDAADERTVGRIGMAFLERGPGWEEFVSQMVDAASEPVVMQPRDPKLERRAETAERLRERAEAALAEALAALEERASEVQELTSQRDDLVSEVQRLTADNDDLVNQRQRAVSELKRMEAVMARHVVERKRLEAQVEQMTSAQLATSAVGGGITDEQVRSALDQLEPAVDALAASLGDLRSAATPQLVASSRRTPLPVPPGLFDDSVEYAEYLLAVPGIIVLVDGYNVTREAHDDWELDQQRSWLEQGLRALAARSGANFDVVFDGSDVAPANRARGGGSVRVRFSPHGVEADDVIIDAVHGVASERAVAVVSSDRRVREGTARRGANVLYAHQLLSVMS